MSSSLSLPPGQGACVRAMTPGTLTHKIMDPTSINTLCSSDDEDSDLFKQWREYRLMWRLAREHRYKLPNLWDWDGSVLTEGQHYHHSLSENITLKTLFNVLKPEPYMKQWIRQKKQQPDTIVLIEHNNWYHAFHQDADFIHQLVNMEYDPGNIARVSIHGIYMKSLLGTIDFEEFKYKII